MCIWANNTVWKLALFLLSPEMARLTLAGSPLISSRRRESSDDGKNIHTVVDLTFWKLQVESVARDSP